MDFTQIPAHARIANPHASSDALEPQTLKLALGGNVTFSVKLPSGKVEQRFLVSQEVLSLGSSYFRGLLEPRVHREHHDICFRAKNTKQVKSMEILLSTLHFKHGGGYLEAKMIALVAELSRMLGCNEALAPWASEWLSRDLQWVKPKKKAKEIGYFLTAAYLFNSNDDFYQLSRMAIREMPVDLISIWTENKIISLLPRFIIDNVAHENSKFRDKLTSELHLTAERLRAQSEEFPLRFTRCERCPALVSTNVVFCDCGHVPEEGVTCNANYRVAKYLQLLRYYQLWPTRNLYSRHGVPHAAFILERVTRDNMHWCDAGETCPLNTEVRKLEDNVEHIASFCGYVSMTPPDESVESEELLSDFSEFSEFSD